MHKVKIFDDYSRYGSPFLQKVFHNIGHLEFGKVSRYNIFDVRDSWIAPVRENLNILEQLSHIIYFKYDNKIFQLSMDDSEFDILVTGAVEISDNIFETKRIEYKIPPKVFKVYICIEEQLILKRKLKSNEIVITTTPTKAHNTFYDWRLCILHFYYLLGYYHINYQEIGIKKSNLLGVYHRKNYKIDRDNAFNDFEKIGDFKIYGKRYEDDFASMYDLRHNEGWYKIHTSHYLDYITSVCNLVFESSLNDPMQHPSEKLIKCLLFSKLNIFFMFYSSPSLIIKLYDSGFWFLNFNFIDFNELKKCKEEKQNWMIHDSITDTIKYLNNLFKKHNDLDLVQKELEKLYKPKLEKNYNLFFEILNNKDISKNVLDFIISSYKKYQKEILL